MKPLSRICLLTGLTLLMWWGLLPAAASESEPRECEPFDDDCVIRQPASADDDSPDDSFFSFLDRPQDTLSYGLNEMAIAMDEFFAEERVFYDKSGSYVRLTADMVFDDVGDTRYIGDVKVKMRLPRTEEKLKLTFESNPDEQRDDLDRTLEDSPGEAAREREYYGGIQATLGDEKKWRFKPSIGVKFDKPIDIYLRLRMDRNYKTGNWLFRPSQTFYAFKEKGFGSDTQFVLDYAITDNVLFRSSSFVRYTDENDYYEPSQVFSLLHSLSRRRGMAYQIGVYGNSEPIWHATDYLAQIRYRQNIHSDYLFMELLPRVLYQRENNFEAERSLTLRLEMIFEG
ncbi:MAG: hypothetical protein ACLFV1_11035 [Thiohalophilus sp.]